MPYKPLTSARFSGNSRLRAAANNAPTLKKGASGEAVRIIQQALIDQGIALPKSTKKYGTPDGVFGSETKIAVINFQQNHDLAYDGVVGMNTMQKLDELFPDWAPAPPPVFPTTYQVPGMRHLIHPTKKNGCWALVYTMIRSWKDGVPYTVETALGKIDPAYITAWNREKGLALGATKMFYKDGGLKFNDLQSLTPEGWIEMLMNHGMLMISTSYSATDNGNHANLVWGVFGDGTVERTQIGYIDPTDGVNHYETFESFHKRFLGMQVVEDGLNDDEVMDWYVQIAHF
jgi:peptidoglycan hydrolase-like protein with peptidoglycan-binding domain